MQVFIYKKNSEKKNSIYLQIYGQHCLALKLFDQESNKEKLLVKSVA